MLIGLTGRIASGKGVIKDFLEKKGFIYITFSDIVREEAAKRGIEITRKNLQDLGNEVRKVEGGGAWAKRIAEKLEKGRNYVIDGIRNPGEIAELGKAGNFYLIAVDAPKKQRCERVLSRAKPSDPKTWEGFLEMDERDFGKNEPEYGQQVGKCMNKADYLLINDSDKNAFEGNIEKVYKDILRRNNKEKC